MQYVLSSVVALLLAFAIGEPSSRPEGNLHRLTIYRLHDADTISDCNINLGFNVTLMHQSIRLMGFDAPEVSRTRQGVEITDEEIVLGKEARDALKDLLLEGTAYISPAANYKDPRGRQGGWLYIYRESEWLDVAEWAKEHGYVRVNDRETK